MEFDFSSNATVKSLDDVPDWARPLYGEAAEDGHPLRDELKATAAAYDGINKALASARKAEREMKRTKLGPWLDLGESPDAIKAEMDDLREQLQSASKGKVNLDKMKADMDQNIAKSVAAKDAELAKMQRTLEKHMIDSDAIAAIAAEKGSVDLLLPHVRQQMRIMQDGEEWVRRVVDSAGDPRGNGQGGFMGPADLVREMKASESFGRAFDAPARAGAGTGANGANPGHHRPANSTTTRTPLDKIGDGLKARGIG